MDLLRRAQSGDMEAFAELFEPLRGRVFAAVVQLVGANDAEDVVMQTYLKAWQGIPRYNGRAALGTWLFRIARNCALDHLRREKVRYAESLDADEREPGQRPVEDVDTKTPADELMTAESVSAVQAAIERLPPVHREVIVLRYVEDLKYAEIGAALGISLGTVMSRLFHGHAKLRKILQNEYKDGK